MDNYTVYTGSLVTDDLITWNIEAANEEEAWNKGYGLALKSDFADSGGISILKSNEFDIAKQYGILNNITLFKEALGSLDEISDISFDMTGLHDNIKDMVLTCGYSISHSSNSFYNDRVDLIRRINETGTMCSLSRTRDAVEDHGQHLYIVFDCSDWIKKQMIFSYFSEEGSHQYLYSSSDIQKIVKDISEFGGVIMAEDGEVIVDTSSGIGVECGSYSKLLSDYSDQILDEEKKYVFKVESMWDGDTYSHHLSINGDKSVSSWVPLTLSDFKLGIKEYQHKHKTDEPLTYNSNKDLFNGVISEIKNADRMPDNLEYTIAGSGNYDEPVFINTTEFEISSKLDYGASEGIYLDFFTLLHEDHEIKEVKIGTIKTLDESRESFESMGKLLGDFIYESHKYIHKYYDEFDRTGYAVRGVLEDGTEGNYSLLADTYDRAIERISEVFAGNRTRDPESQFVKAKIINKRTREEILIENPENETIQNTLRGHRR